MSNAVAVVVIWHTQTQNTAISTWSLLCNYCSDFASSVRCWLDMGCWYHVCKTKDDQTTGFSPEHLRGEVLTTRRYTNLRLPLPTFTFSCSALTLYVKRQEGRPARKNPVVIPVSVSFVRALAHPGYPGSQGHFLKWLLLLLLWDFISA